MEDIKIRLSELPGKCSQVELLKFIVPCDADLVRIIFVGLVQVYASYDNFQVFKLHDTITNGPDRRKYVSLRLFWTEMGMVKNSCGMVLSCSSFVVSPPQFFIVDGDKYNQLMELPVGHMHADIDAFFAGIMRQQ